MAHFSKTVQNLLLLSAQGRCRGSAWPSRLARSASSTSTFAFWPSRFRKCPPAASSTRWRPTMRPTNAAGPPFASSGASVPWATSTSWPGLEPASSGPMIRNLKSYKNNLYDRGWHQFDQMVILFFNFWPFTKTENYPRENFFAKVIWNIVKTLNKALKNCLTI